jgi:hypothetical protein
LIKLLVIKGINPEKTPFKKNNRDFVLGEIFKAKIIEKNISGAIANRININGYILKKATLPGFTIIFIV